MSLIPNENIDFTSDDFGSSSSKNYPKHKNKYKKGRGNYNYSYNRSPMKYKQFQRYRYDNFKYNSPRNKQQQQDQKYSYRHEPSQFSSKRKKKKIKKPSRPQSPLVGTEEHTMKQIAETSKMIQLQLLYPHLYNDNVNKKVQTKEVLQEDSTSNNKNKEIPAVNITKSQNQKKQLSSVYNVNEIHDKIINHISNMSYARKKNLICSSSSELDLAIQHIQKQKRLELSKALREMCSNNSVENVEIINSIIPDMDIKIEQLPVEFLQELCANLDMNVDGLQVQNTQFQPIHIKQEPIDFQFSTSNEVNCSEPSINIKMELIEVESDGLSANNEVETSQFNCTNDTNDETQTTDDIIQSQPTEISSTSNLLAKQITANNNSNESPNLLTKINSLKSALLELTEELTPTETDHSSIPITATQNQTQEKNKPETVSISVQTDLRIPLDRSILNEDELLDVSTLEEALVSMSKIDDEIMRFTKLRQSIFYNLNNKLCTNGRNNKRKSVPLSSRGDKKRKLNGERDKNQSVVPIDKKDVQNRKEVPELARENQIDMDHQSLENKIFENALRLGDMKEKILAMKVTDNILWAGAESGALFSINLLSDQVVEKIVISSLPIISLSSHLFKQNRKKRDYSIFIGTTESILYEYKQSIKKLLQKKKMCSGIQCMEIKWNFLFMGTCDGNLVRYSLYKNKIEFEDQISTSSVLVLKAAQEGARKVLLIGQRNTPVYIRCAMTGLHLRTMENLISPTIYSLLLEDSLVYCGTTSHNILVYKFHDGSLVHKYDAFNSKGIGCLKIIGNLLFASCHDGKIYVFHRKTYSNVGSLQGPGGVVLSMEIVGNLIIIGTMSLNFTSIIIPESILKVFYHSK